MFCGKLRSCHVEGCLPCQVHLASVASVSSFAHCSHCSWNRGFRMFQGQFFATFPVGVAPVGRSRTSVPPSRLHESNDSSKAPHSELRAALNAKLVQHLGRDSLARVGHVIGLRGCNIHHSIHSYSFIIFITGMHLLVLYSAIYFHSFFIFFLTFLHSHCQAHVHVHAMQHSTGVVLDGIVFPRCSHGSFTSTGQ